MLISCTIDRKSFALRESNFTIVGSIQSVEILEGAEVDLITFSNLKITRIPVSISLF